MKTIQIVIEPELLRAVDRAARRSKASRSAFFRAAARDYLKRARTKELEDRHRAGYQRHPATEFDVWDRVAAWPEG